MLTTFRYLALAWILTSVPAFAEVVTLSKEAVGTGGSRGEAVLTALERAVGKAFGFNLSGELQRFTSEHSSYSNDGGNELLIAAVSREVSQKVKTPDNRPVVGYEVLSASETSIGWEARVQLFYKSYKKLGAPDTRRTVVVVAEDAKSAPLADQLESSLIASRRFNVLNRDSRAAFEAEKAFIRSSDASSGEVARFGQGEGADYLVLLRSSGHYDRQAPVRVIKATGEKLYHAEAGYSYDLEVVEFSSREIKWRKQGSVHVESEEPGSAAGRLGSRSKKIAETLANDLAGAIYPARIAQINGKQAVLNRGSGAVQLGQQVNIYLLGEGLIDPQSGESLGAMETWTASGRVIDIKPKFSIISVTEGEVVNGNEYIVRWPDLSQQVFESTAREADASKEATREKLNQLDDAFLN
jgi:curli biogenesis system outer membrane secretion channel CsgG